MNGIRRYYEKGSAYFVTTVAHGRKNIFTDEILCKIALLTIEYFKLLLDYKIFAYCLMPDHLHMIIQPVGEYDLSYIMKMIKGSFARKINKFRNSSGPIWQKRFYDEGIRNYAMLIQKIEYIHNNPVRKKIVTLAEDYPYSSYHWYFGNNKNVLEIDRLDD